MEKPNRFFFNKNEKLTSKKLIADLFKNGKSIFVSPLSSRFLIVNKQDSKAKILITVSKKYFKSAVKRNKVKRLLREAYRMNRNQNLILSENFNHSILIVFYYSSTEILSFDEIVISMKKILADISIFIKKYE